MRISHSSLDTFLKCPLKYKFNQIDKIEEEKSKPAVMGSFFHLIMHYIYEKDISKISFLEIEKFIKKEHPSVQYYDFNEKTNKNLTNEDLEYIIDKTKLFYETNKNKKTQILSLEEKFEITLQDKTDIHILSGIIDRFDKISEDNYEIIDYKTSNKLSSYNQVAQNKQLSIYGLGILSKWPNIALKNLKFSLYFLKQNEKIQTKRTEKDLEETKQEVIKQINQIQKTKVFNPNCGWYCSYCGYKHICPIYKNEYCSSKTKEETKQLIEEYFKIEEEKQNLEKKEYILKTKISNYMTKTKTLLIKSNSGFFKLQPEKIESYNWVKVREILKPLKKWNKILKIDLQNFNKILKEIPEKERIQIDSLKTTKNQITIQVTNTKNIQNGQVKDNIKNPLEG